VRNLLPGIGKQPLNKVLKSVARPDESCEEAVRARGIDWIPVWEVLVRCRIVDGDSRGGSRYRRSSSCYEE